MAKVIWDMWNFDEVEIDLRDYARENGFDYDEKHPLSILPNNAAKSALDAIGGSYAEIAQLMPANLKTVSGWFAPGRNPSRSVVAHNIIPALCEMYVRHTETKAWQYIFDRGEYISEGKRPSKNYALMVQSRIFLILTTGEDVSDEDRAEYMERGLEAYYRGVTRYAAAYLEGDELAAVAQTALNALIAHANLPSSQKEYPDEITGMYRRFNWYFHAGNAAEKGVFPETISTKTGDVEPDPDDYPFFAGMQFSNAAVHHHINQMSNSYLEHFYEYIAEVFDRREFEERQYEEEIRRGEEYEAEMKRKRELAEDEDEQQD